MTTVVKNLRLIETAPEIQHLGHIPLDQIDADLMGPAPDEQFCRAIEENGVITPILVIPKPDGRYDLRNGRKRVQAARRAGLETIRADACVNHVPGLIEPALTIVGNVHRASPIIELRALEDLELAAKDAGKTADPPAIAKSTGKSLTGIRKVLSLRAVRGELRQAWELGQFADAVGWAISKLSGEQQEALLPTLAANGTLTKEDVRNAKKTNVTGHQRTLAEDNWKPRVTAHLKAALAEVIANDEEDGDLAEAIRTAIELAGETEGA